MNSHFLVYPILAAGGQDGGHNPMAVDFGMAIVVWVCFILLCLILYKFAWKPILTGLDKREETIRKALEDAEQAAAELAKIGDSRATIIAEADTKAKEIVATARKAAVEGARVIENKAKEESQILLENATREINAAREKAEARLRYESAELAIGLASKLIGENLDDAKNRALTDRLIADI